jgi:lauroyl/myristoyl acyltransferase
MDLVTPAYRGASALARWLPGELVDGGASRIAELMAVRESPRRAMVERHQRRIDPTLSGAALRARVRAVYRSYGRYYGESFRLPSVSPRELDARMSYEGYEHIRRARAAGIGPLLVLPHLGSWEWSAYWLTRVEGVPVTAVVDWFVAYRESIGMRVVPLGPDAGRAVVASIRRRDVVALLCDRDIGRAGVEVTFFGERTTLPSGPAVLALRTGAPLLPTAIYDRGSGHHGVVHPPVAAERRDGFRADVARITQALACELEELIRAAPEQWHMLQPNWPSDRAGQAPVRL